MSVRLFVNVIIVFKHTPSTYCFKQGSCCICINIENVTSKLESQPLKQGFNYLKKMQDKQVMDTTLTKLQTTLHGLRLMLS